MRFLYGAIANCDRALAVHNGEASLKTGDGAFPVAGAEALPAISPIGPGVEDPKISQVIEEIVSAKTTPKSRKEPRWSKKHPGRVRVQIQLYPPLFRRGDQAIGNNGKRPVRTDGHLQ